MDLLDGNIQVGFRRKTRVWCHGWSELEMQWRAIRTGGGTGRDGGTVVAQGKNQSWMSGVRIWPRTEETGMSTSTSQVLLRHPLRAF